MTREAGRGGAERERPRPAGTFGNHEQAGPEIGRALTVSTATKTQTPADQAPARRGAWWWAAAAAVAGAAAGAGALGWYDRHPRSAAPAHGPAEAGAGAPSEDSVPVETVRVTKGGIVRVSAQIG